MTSCNSSITYILYGIKNCDTVKKARRWLDEHNISYRFHDYRNDGLTLVWLREIGGELEWSTLLNRQGTTWRKLSPEQQATVHDADSAFQLMLEQPALIKRPLLSDGQRYLLGFNTDYYKNFLCGS